MRKNIFFAIHVNIWLVKKYISLKKNKILCIKSKAIRKEIINLNEINTDLIIRCKI